MSNIVGLEDFVTRSPEGHVQIDNTTATCVVEFRDGTGQRKIVGRCPRIIFRADGSVLRMFPVVSDQNPAYFEPEIDMNDVIRARVVHRH